MCSDGKFVCSNIFMLGSGKRYREARAFYMLPPSYRGALTSIVSVPNVFRGARQHVFLFPPVRCWEMVERYSGTRLLHGSQPSYEGVSDQQCVFFQPVQCWEMVERYQAAPSHGSPPSYRRCWEIVERYQARAFYTAPTLIRSLLQHGDEWVQKHDLSSLRVLGTAGEPIGAHAWQWYHDTETGSVMLTPFPAAWCHHTPKPGSARLPFFGVQPALMGLDGAEVKGAGQGLLVLKAAPPSMARTLFGDKERFESTYFADYREDTTQAVITTIITTTTISTITTTTTSSRSTTIPWTTPQSMARTLFGDKERFESTYFADYKGCYFTGDGCRRDDQGDYWITGRVDDVINISGHRIGTAEVEGVMRTVRRCGGEAGHWMKGQSIYAYVTLRDSALHGVEMKRSLVQHVGAFEIMYERLAVLRSTLVIHWAPALPKTRSGKLMRRVLKKIALGEEEDLGDVSTLADPSVIELLPGAGTPTSATTVPDSERRSHAHVSSPVSYLEATYTTLARFS
eukprot:gene9639-7552_t